MLERILSGAQTGADRGGLDAALSRGVAVGGWIPRGRRAEDGRIPVRYVGLTETPTADYRDRTGRNVRDSDATLIFTRGPLSGGSLLTAGLCRKHRKPCLHVDLAAAPDPLAVSAWLRDHVVRVLNVAGQRESKAPGLQAEVAAFMGRILAAPAPSL